MQLIASAVVFAAVVAPSLAQGPSFQVNTPPSCAQCAPCLLTWSESPQPLPPFIVTILPAAQPGATPLLPSVITNSTMITFNAPLGANSQFTLEVTDNTGQKQFSSPINVVAGPSTSCLNGTGSPFSGSGVSSSGGGSSSSGGNPPPSGSSSSPSSGGASASSTSPSGSSTASSGTTSASSSTSPSATPKSDAATISTGLFGFISVVVAAFLA